MYDEALFGRDLLPGERFEELQIVSYLSNKHLRDADGVC